MKVGGWKRILQSLEVGALDVLIFPKWNLVPYNHLTDVLCVYWDAFRMGEKKFNLYN